MDVDTARGQAQGQNRNELLTPSLVQGELRILDVSLAERLGFAQPRDIRKLIKRHETALSQLGTVARHRGAQLRANGASHEVDVFHLNRKQAIFITAKSDTPAATETCPSGLGPSCWVQRWEPCPPAGSLHA
ncbi:hypothetical protein TSH58p_22535 (plasmid) [Azospirillum sp. TSH58]|uniref:hypothetical protein n=1 Tax=Azospirillum sp. TSH58 TaxID=664962 RepID=UPI000D5FFC43|nr:hypothetical protein [Azospirillum sp. TSH58]AWJ86301.1 hypothetical protein TSH58p_22535 [Azospirillum sp. TSH58]PWC57886.1 hypothetical protein TSH58_30925 [Azospirillum sp. TSH58]